MAQAALSGPVTYITPSITMGVASNLWPEIPVWNVHCALNCATLAGVICVSGLCR